MNYWYEILAELPCEIEYGDTGIIDSKERTYKGENLIELVNEVVNDNAIVIDAFQIFYDKPFEESASVTRKIIDLVGRVKNEKKV